MWIILILLVIFLFLSQQKEGFSMRYGPYPTVFKNYGMDDWHKYWHVSKEIRVPMEQRFDKYIEGAPNYSCDRCYYPMPMPFN